VNISPIHVEKKGNPAEATDLIRSYEIAHVSSSCHLRHNQSIVLGLG